MASKFAKVEANNYCWWRVVAQYCVIYFFYIHFLKSFIKQKYMEEKISLKIDQLL